jgi:hypothetical protein
MKCLDLQGNTPTLADLHEIKERNPELGREAEILAIKFIGNFYSIKEYKDYLLAKAMFEHGFLAGANDTAGKK